MRFLNVFRHSRHGQKLLKIPGYPSPPPYQESGKREKAVPVEEGRQGICCAVCHFKVTDFESVMEVGGQHEHTFVNPSGMAFRIGCFSSAKGCRVEGSPTQEFTWFPGFRWSFALCRNCGIHLGWYYDAQGADGFYGLILARLAWSPRG